MRRLLTRLVTLGTVSLGLAVSVGFAAPLSMSPQEARAFAWRSLQQDRPHIALQIAEALHTRDPDSYEASLLRGEALRQLRQTKAAKAAALKAWSAAETPEHRFNAAHLVAKTYFADGAKLRAQFWLRRAAQNAPDAQARRMAQRDFNVVRRSKLLSTALSFSVFPSSNINNGSTNDALVIGGLPFRVPASGQPHSGTGFRLGISTRYNKALNDRTLLRLGFSATGTTYKLSSESKALGSGKTGSDFAYAAVEVQAGVTLYPDSGESPGFGATRFDLALGRSWYGGSPLSNFLRVGAAQDYHLSKTARLRGTLELERQNRLDAAISSANIASFTLDMQHRFKNRARVGYGLYLRDTSSRSNLVESRVAGAQLSYSPPPLPVDVVPTFSLSAERTDYPRLNIGGVQRVDERARAAVSLLFPAVNYYGFAPTLNLSASRTNSTVPIYSTKDLRMNIGFKSTF
ncbi:surface lipoprotein assembly modifier [Neptunicoccus sediminis]|uniref:surface lipoprotein assembly modifier n=1 Tax=Neptunicoccus sediminis TaxID=1892596 RepID=UPI000845ED38|nr:surface lipoprotein assembly modifier [Neptunicoccus sediminis]